MLKLVFNGLFAASLIAVVLMAGASLLLGAQLDLLRNEPRVARSR